MVIKEFDAGAVRSAIIAGLPIRARWMVEDTPIDFDFTVAHEGLRNVTTDDVSGGIDEEWTELLIFGHFDYAEGGGASQWITARKTDGAVCGLDLEREPAIFVYNTSVDKFIRSFFVLDQYLGHGRPLPSDIESLMRDVDRDCYPASEWRSLIDFLTAE
jgi:hypothetical protein